MTMRALDLDEVLRLHRELIDRFGGLDGVHDVEALKSAIAHPFQTFLTETSWLALCGAA